MKTKRCQVYAECVECSQVFILFLGEFSQKTPLKPIHLLCPECKVEYQKEQWRETGEIKSAVWVFSSISEEARLYREQMISMKKEFKED